MGDTQELIEPVKWALDELDGSDFEAIRGHSATLRKALASLQRHEEKLREALAFYAEEARYEYDETCCWCLPTHRAGWKGLIDAETGCGGILADNGARARQALEDTDSGPADAPNGGTTLQEEQS